VSSLYNDQGSAIGYDFWDGAGERPGRSIHELASDLEGSYAIQFGRLTATADITGYGRASLGGGGYGGSVEYRIPVTEVPEAVLSASARFEGEGAPAPEDIRFTFQGPALRGRLTEDFSTGTTVVDLGINAEPPDWLLDLGLPQGSMFYGGSHNQQCR